MKRVLGLLLCLCGLLACGAEEEKALGSYSDLCDGAGSCDEAQGFVCVATFGRSGICTTNCTTDGDCVRHGGKSVCVGGGVGNGYCYEKCVDSVECPRGLICTMQATESYSTCRAEN